MEINFQIRKWICLIILISISNFPISFSSIFWRDNTPKLDLMEEGWNENPRDYLGSIFFQCIQAGKNLNVLYIFAESKEILKIEVIDGELAVDEMDFNEMLDQGRNLAGIKLDKNVCEMCVDFDEIHLNNDQSSSNVFPNQDEREEYTTKQKRNLLKGLIDFFEVKNLNFENINFNSIVHSIEEKNLEEKISLLEESLQLIEEDLQNIFKEESVLHSKLNDIETFFDDIKHNTRNPTMEELVINFYFIFIF